MRLNLQSLKNEKEAWKKAGFVIPEFDIEDVKKNTAESPVWLHFGAGNIFRGFIARIADDLIADGKLSSGIIAADTFDGEIIDKIYDPFDNLTLFVGLKNAGAPTRRVIAGVADAIKVDAEHMAKLVSIAENKSLQLISMTITEKGYACYGINGEILPFIQSDVDAGPQNPSSAMGVLTALLYSRFKAGAYPLAMVSMDNCSKNGEKLRNAIKFMAEKWAEKGLVEKEFLDYVLDETKVSFPWSMIDKITPRPADAVLKTLEESGIEDMAPIITSKRTYIAPFVNAEIPEYLVIEDSFPNGRPAFEEAGIYMADRDTVSKAEGMKVMTCLNPLHTALAVTGCLLGFDSIADEMKDADLRKLVYRLGMVEGLPVVQNPGIISPDAFLCEVLEERLPNKMLGDTPQRIVSDTSQKLAIRFGGTVRKYEEKGKVDSLQVIPLVIAAWFRYIKGIDDNGNEMKLSPDPMLEYMASELEGAKFGEALSSDAEAKVREILTNKELFGTDLVAAGMADAIVKHFNELLSGVGAVRKTIKELVSRKDFLDDDNISSVQ